MKLLLVMCVSLLAGCAVAPPQGDVVLRLAPGSLGRELALQQRMTVSSHGRTERLDLAIESDQESVRLAVMDFGQTVMRLEWDGQALKESRATGWPAFITPERVLSDLQLVHWPLESIRPVLPAGWSVDDEAGTRVVRVRGEVAIRIRHSGTDNAELEHLAAKYRVRLEPWPRSAP
jgi:Protein of unknown function (DUF3261)